MSLPNPIATGQPITADWLNRLRAETAANTWRSSAHMRIHRDSAGTTGTPIFPRITASGGGSPETFLVNVTGESEVTVSGGTLIHVFNNFALLIPESAPLTVADGDAVWLERTGANTWGFNNGPDTPTDKLNILLAVCAVDEDGIVTINFDGGWHGGDIIVPEIFPVDLTNDGGAAGDAVSTCNLTYAAEAGGVTIEAGMSPVADRMPNVEYTVATVGICRIKPDGNFELIAALDEIPVPVSVLLAVVTAKDGDCYTIEPHAAMVLSVDPDVTEP